MTLALDLTAAGSISVYSELVEAIRDMADDDAYPVASIDDAIRKSEAYFNRKLRVPDMEAIVTLTVTGEYASLPADYREMRAIRPVSDPCRELASMSPAALYMTYRGQAGSPVAYAVEGLQLRFGPVGNGLFDMLYYQAIPVLTDSSPSNWLLEKHPDAYVSGVMFYLALRERDGDMQNTASGLLNQIVGDIQAEGNSARWGAGPLIPQGIGQVCGGRA